MTCQQETCPFWTGSGCLCAVMELDDEDRKRAKANWEDDER